MAAATGVKRLRWRWHVAAGGLLAVAGAVNMRAWFLTDLLPSGDFPGYVAVLVYVRDALLRYGRVPVWCSRFFVGTTAFTSSLKEYATVPLTLWLEPVLAMKVMFLVTKVLGALGVYGIFVRLFAAPAAGIVAGYAYTFGACSNADADHLDVHFSEAFFPLLLLAAVGVLRERRWRAAVLLGVAYACQLANNWVQAMVVPVMVGLVAAIRPWRAGASAEVSPGGRHPAVLLAGALGVFLLFAASQLAWVAADLQNHYLIAPDIAAQQREFGRYAEQTPFRFINRADWLGDWLATHRPLDPDPAHRAAFEAARRYLGGVVLAVASAGWFLLRREAALRRWYQTAALLFLFQYWMALGPQTLVWQLGRSLHWPEAADRMIRLGLTTGAVTALGAALSAVLRRRRTGAPARERVELCLGLALVLVFPAHSLGDALRAGVPVVGSILDLQRSPGHFFDLAPFSLALLFGFSLVALERRIARRRVAAAVTAGLAALVVIDFWPSTREFARGTPMAPLRRFAQTLERLPAEGGSLRLNLYPGSVIPSSLLAMATEAGAAWTWLPWQAGRHWPPYALAATWRVLNAGRLAPVGPSGAAEPLLTIGRLRYFLYARADGPTPALGPPWMRVAADDDRILWQLPEVAPMAVGYRTHLLLVGERDEAAVPLVRDVFARNVVVLHGGARLAESAELVEGAALALCRGEEALADPASRALAAAHPGRVVDLRQISRARWDAFWDSFVQGTAAGPLLRVRYRRPAPERVVLKTDAGAAPALVFVSEGYHPWWRATVDGRPAPVVRAQVAFLAVPVGPGRHVIELRLRRPRHVAAADATTALAWLGLALGLFALAGRRLARRGGA